MHRTVEDAGEPSDKAAEPALEAGTEPPGRGGADLFDGTGGSRRRKPRARRWCSGSGKLRRSTSRPEGTSGGTAAPGRRLGRAKRHRSPVSSGSLAVGENAGASPRVREATRRQGAPTRRPRRAPRRVVPRAMGRQPQGFRELLHAAGACGTHRAAHLASARLRPADRSGWDVGCRCASRAMDAEAPPRKSSR